jgi:hypothetical protein
MLECELRLGPYMSQPSPFDREVITRPNQQTGGWRIAFPRVRGEFVVVVADRLSALRLAKSLGQQADIRVIHDQDKGL